MSPARPVMGSRSQRWLPGMYCKQPLSRMLSSRPIQQVRWAIGCGAGPVRIVLVPGDHAAVLRRLAEELVVPEPHGAVEQLARRHRERRIPEDVVERRRDPPGPEGMEQHPARVGRLVGVVLVPQFLALVVRVEQPGELASQPLDLVVVEQADPGDVAVFVEERDLFVAQAVPVPLVAGLRQGDQVADGGVLRREVGGHVWVGLWGRRVRRSRPRRVFRNA